MRCAPSMVFVLLASASSGCERPSACIAEIAGRTECWQNVSAEFCTGFPFKRDTTCAKEGFELQMGPETWIREEVGSCRWPSGACEDGVKKGVCFFGPREGGAFHRETCEQRAAAAGATP